MLDIKLIIENSEKVKASAQRRGIDVDISKILELDKKRRNLIPKIEELRAERNKISDVKQKPSQEIIEMAKQIKKDLAKIEPELENTKTELNDLMMAVPNLLHPDVPDGKDDSENKELMSWGGKPSFKFKPKDHEQIGKDLDIIDIEQAVEVSGSGFFFLKNQGAILEFALVNFVFDFLYKKGFIPIIAPELIRKKVATGTGYIPKLEEPDIYKIENQDLYLSATAEIPLTAYHMNQVLDEKDLPKNYVGFSSCFRKEAGAYGKHKKGIFRVHQFDKVEIYKFTQGDIDVSQKAFKEIIELEKEIMKKLGIPFRVVNICTGDMSAPAYIKYDLEYWSPVDNMYREITSCSNCTDFQARRLSIRYRTNDGKIRFVHTLNGTAITSTRTIIAILENYQQKDGSIKMPKVLHKYLGFKKIQKK